jgi:hypothetical protein
VGQPFDTIKVLQQTKSFSPRASSSMISIIRKPLNQLTSKLLRRPVCRCGGLVSWTDPSTLNFRMHFFDCIFKL